MAPMCRSTSHLHYTEVSSKPRLPLLPPFYLCCDPCSRASRPKVFLGARESGRHCIQWNDPTRVRTEGCERKSFRNQSRGNRGEVRPIRAIVAAYRGMKKGVQMMRRAIHSDNTMDDRLWIRKGIIWCLILPRSIA